MKHYKIKKNKWTMRVLPILCVTMGILIVLGIIFPGSDEYNCKDLQKILTKDFDRTEDPQLIQQYQKCIVQGYPNIP